MKEKNKSMEELERDRLYIEFIIGELSKILDGWKKERFKILDAQHEIKQKELIKTFAIKTQEDLSKSIFPECERNEDGFALPKKDFWYYLTGKLPYGPMPYMKGMSSLAAVATIQWDGRIEEINQWSFRNNLVEVGKMRNWT